MTAYSTKGQKAYLLKADAVASAIVPTAITAAAPAVLTVASTAGRSVGDLLVFPAAGTTGASGFPELDGKTWVVGALTGTTLTLVGSDTTGTTGVLAAGVSIDAYENPADFASLDLSEITLNPETPNTVSVATFKDPSATIPSQVVGAGTVDLAGYVDKADPGYVELRNAESDGVSRKWLVEMSNDQGYTLLEGVLSVMSIGMPIDGAYAWTGTITLSTKYRHLF